VICTKDRPDYLQNCLSSFKDQKCKPAEIIVVDNASSDTRTKEVVQRFLGVIYIREDRKGLDIARNTGAKHTTQDIVAYTDDDTVLHQHWVYEVYKTFSDSSVAAMTGLILAQEINTEAQWIFEAHWPFNRGFVDKRYDKNFFSNHHITVPPVWEIGAGANMAFRKRVFMQAGYFDERLDVGAAGCNGDSEIWYRILANGSTILYNPRAIVSHKHRESMEGLKHQIFYYMRGFASAVLFQYQAFGHKGNINHLFKVLPKYYLKLVYRGFPQYKDRYTTVFDEIRGMVSGLLYYLANRKNPSNIK
jgi:glycosyltransferase involved in cell wall biosynthesis